MQAYMKIKRKNLNIADWVTVSRFVLIPVLLFLIFREERNGIGWVLLAGFSTDALDGFLARGLKKTTENGARPDTIADMVFLICGLFGFYRIFQDFVMARLWIVIAVISLFTVQYFLSLLRYGKASSFHTYLAKITAIALAAFLVTAFLIKPFPWLYYFAFGIAILEAVEEIILVCLLPAWQTNVKGAFWARTKK